MSPQSVATHEANRAVQVHPAETVITPSGDRVRIDCEMVPLVQALWNTGMETLQCCEDVGASIYGGGWLYPRPRRVRYAAFWDGFAWLKMPVEDAERLVALTAEIAAGHGWECGSPINRQGRLPVANLYFPACQVAQVLNALERM